MNSRLYAPSHEKFDDRPDGFDVPGEELLELTAVLLVVIVVAVATSGAMHEQSQKQSRVPKERECLLDEVLPDLENVLDEAEAQRSTALSRSFALIQIV